MNGLTFVFSIIFYISINIFFIGLMWKFWKYVSTPAPLKIPQTPAPKSGAGVGIRMFQEIFFFKSLFKGNRLIWLGGYVMHIGLLFVFLKHLRFFFPSTPPIVDTLVDIDLYSGFIFIGGLIFLFILRLAIDRTFYVSVFNDYLLLGLMIAIATTGLLARFWDYSGTRAMIPDIKAFVGGLFTFSPGNVPLNKPFLVHFLLVMTLLIYFPFSKLVHSIGIFFSPTRNQIDNTRKKRWGPWTVRNPRRSKPAEQVAVQPSFSVTEEPSDS